MSVPEVIDASFHEEVIKSSCPVLVDFWAPWCGPCRMVAPVIDQIANEYKDKLKVVTLNTDENPSTTTEYGIRSIPTLMIFVEGQRVYTVIGAVPKSTLATTLEKYIKNSNQ
uniref:thioredoxin n=1 Tax=Gracilaria cearensis TaxID=1574224 RepID=UPI001D10C654|nr:thioredoxin [Gracilaria cearensis]UAD83733.1 thioredoxin [Gracilaria cearensis]